MEPAPKERRTLTSLQTYVHGSPLLSIEVVSTTHPTKDYVEAPARHAASGVQELWVLDPLLAGPRMHGGPFVVQSGSATPLEAVKPDAKLANHFNDMTLS